MSESVHIINTPPGWLKSPPLGCAYLKTFLDKNGVETKILDLNAALFQLYNLPKNEWLALNDDFERNLFGESEKTFPQFFDNVYRRLENSQTIGFSLFKRNTHFTLSLARKIKERFPQKRIVFGGPQTIFFDKMGILDKDYTWVIGEGELPFLKIAQGDKTRIFRFEEVPKLDTLPFIDFDGFGLKSYQPILPLFSSRGCRFRCSFCSENLLYQKFRQHSPGYMADEIKNLKSKYAINTFVFCDSMINSDIDWLNAFCDKLIGEELNIKWEAQIRVAANFPQEVALKMKKSGCYNLFIGLESGSNRILNLMQKGFNCETASAFFNCLKTAALHFEISLIFGYPEETENDFQETIAFISKNKELIPKVAQVNPFVDYLNAFPDKTFPSPDGLRRVKDFIDFLNKEEIIYTRSFINNLIY
jgi:radical SAM superfamily enzyme YgiQ (UPF0313 family)